MNPAPRIIAWELTRRCELKCRHCRGGATNHEAADSLSTAECFKTIDAIANVAKPMLILTGGEPLMRHDLFSVAAYATQSGCRVVLATCGHLLTPAVVDRLKACGIVAVSISLDAATAADHDAFRGVAGAYEKSLAGLAHLRAADMPFQINTTVSKLNVKQLPKVMDQSVRLGAIAQDFFFLVPTGRGAALADMALDPETHDRTLRWIAQQEHAAPLRIRVTCAPRYQAFRLPPGPDRAFVPFQGCMGGRGFVFLSHTGILQPCGFLDLPCGDLRTADFDFQRLYHESKGFKRMRALNPFAACPAREFARSGVLCI